MTVSDKTRHVHVTVYTIVDVVYVGTDEHQSRKNFVRWLNRIIASVCGKAKISKDVYGEGCYENNVLQ